MIVRLVDTMAVVPKLAEPPNVPLLARPSRSASARGRFAG